MPLLRCLISWGPTYLEPRDTITNTLYFNNNATDPDYQDYADNLVDLYKVRSWCAGSVLQVRVYNMEDPEPRPQRAIQTATVTGSRPNAASQVALCLSYYADRNLPSKRGRIYLGPFAQSAIYATDPQINEVLGMAQSFADLGGLNVDWSLYSPKLGTNTRINHAWVDNSWDIIRSRKIKATKRVVNDSLNG